MFRILLVIPCYNEASRFKKNEFEKLCNSNIEMLFVNDGSRDNTEQVIRDFKGNRQEINLLSLERNVGKAEAVRRGLLYGLEKKFDVVGYADADLATPPFELIRLSMVMESRKELKVVMGSRIRMLGVKIDRKGLRHYLGRIFATLASLILRMPVYDTQCGAKFFRSSPCLISALSTPFESRWVFDVELISRLTRPKTKIHPVQTEEFLEVPLHQWTHIGGSKLHPSAMLKALLDLFFIYLRQPSERNEKLH